MNIALDGRILTRNITGTERYVNSLAQSLSLIGDKSHELSILTKPGYENRDLSLKCIPTYCLTGSTGVDLFHRPYQVGGDYDLLELLVPHHSVITILDLILCNHPEYFSDKGSHDNYIRLMELSLHYVDKIIAISHHCKNDIIKKFTIPKEKIEVIHLGIDTQRFNKINELDKKNKLKVKLNLPDKFILCLGTNYPHKNIDNLLKAFKQILAHPKTKDYYLVIGGTNYYCHGNNYLKDSLAAVKDRVKFVGYLEDEDVSTLYNLADLFVYPSLYEGFGFPVLESFACEVPLICSDATSLPEVAGDAAYMIDAKNPHNIAKAIIDVASNPMLRKALIEKGKKRVTQFTWDKCAQSTYDVYEKVLNCPKHFKPKDDPYLKQFFSHIVERNMMYWEKQVVAEESFNLKKILVLAREFKKSLRDVGIRQTMKIVYKYIFKK